MWKSWLGFALLSVSKILDLLANGELLEEFESNPPLARLWVLDTFRAVRRSFKNFLGPLKVMNLDVFPDVSSSLELASYVTRMGEERDSPPVIRAVGAMVDGLLPGKMAIGTGIVVGWRWTTTRGENARLEDRRSANQRVYSDVVP
jgi:hypothetical protein